MTQERFMNMYIYVYPFYTLKRKVQYRATCEQSLLMVVVEYWTVLAPCCKVVLLKY